MDMTVVQAFIRPEMGGLLIVLWVIGAIVKNTKRIADEWIPFIIMALGILGACMISGWNFGSVLQGILCTASAVYSNQIIKQVGKALEKNSDIGDINM